MKLSDAGRKGGKAKVPKGLARMSPERRKEISRKGVEARLKKAGILPVTEEIGAYEKTPDDPK